MTFFKLKVTENNKLINICSTHSLRIFIRNLRTINWQNKDLKAYTKVMYGKYLDNYGKLSTFYNDGIYMDGKELQLASEAFLEEIAFFSKYGTVRNKEHDE